jgi:hypothetical protein
MATTTPNFGWTVPTSTDLVKDGATAIETLGDSIDASFVDLKGGTTGQILSKASGTDLDFTWAAPAAGTFVGVSVSSTTDQTINNATYTALTWDGEYFDTDNYHSNVTNNSRITIPAGKAGKYLISGYVTYDNGTTGSRQLVIRKNGSSTYTQSLTAANFYPTGTVTYIADLAVSDYIEMAVWQSQGSSVTLYKVTNNSSFVMQYLGA